MTFYLDKPGRRGYTSPGYYFLNYDGNFQGPYESEEKAEEAMADYWGDGLSTE